MNGLIYCALNLGPPAQHLKLAPLFDHATMVESSHQTLEYLQGGADADSQQAFVSSRGMTLKGYRVGGLEHDGPKQLKQTLNNLLAINSLSSEDEQRSNSYLSLAYSKVFSKIEGRAFINIDVASSQSKFILMTKGVPVYFLAITNDKATVLIWTNENKLEDRIRGLFGQDYYLYRMPIESNGICVIHSAFLQKRFAHWQRIMRDKLMVMNALESYLGRRWMYPEQEPVNTLNETDHLVSLSTSIGSKEQ